VKWGVSDDGANNAAQKVDPAWVPRSDETAAGGQLMVPSQLRARLDLRGRLDFLYFILFTNVVELSQLKRERKVGQAKCTRKQVSTLNIRGSTVQLLLEEQNAYLCNTRPGDLPSHLQNVMAS